MAHATAQRVARPVRSATPVKRLALRLGILLLVAASALFAVLILKVATHEWEIVPRAELTFSPPPLRDGELGRPSFSTAVVVNGSAIKVGGVMVEAGLPEPVVLVVMLPRAGSGMSWRRPVADEQVYFRLGVPTATPAGIVLPESGSAEVLTSMSLGAYLSTMKSDPELEGLASRLLNLARALGWEPRLDSSPQREVFWVPSGP